MLEDNFNILTRDLYRFIIGSDKEIKGMLIKKHSFDLANQGEFSFPSTVQSWHGCLNVNQSEINGYSLLTYIGKEITDIIDESRKWVLSIKKAIEIKDRIHLFLNRNHAIKVGLANSTLNNSLVIQALGSKTLYAHIDPHCGGHCTTSLRLECMKNVINNLMAIHSIDSRELLNIIITSKSQKKDNSTKLILCGAVLNAKTNVKETNLSGEDFVR